MTSLPPADVVHILHHGRTVCGMKGVPKEWPAGHKWVPADPWNRDDVSCKVCLGREEPAAGLETSHQNKWLESLSLEDLKKWVHRNSCLCDMAGICNGCQLADAHAENERLREEIVCLNTEAERLNALLTGADSELLAKWGIKGE